MPTHQPSSRVLPLEALRGIAALIVVVYNSILAFAPAFMDGGIKGMPWYVFVDGSSMVIFFFVLSGVVLCWSWLGDPAPDKLRQAFLYRWPRLAGLVLLTTVAAWVLLKIGAEHHAEAAALNGSEWLRTRGLMQEGEQPRGGLVSAIAEGLGTFFTGKHLWNLNLWTMRHEFVGSLLVFVLAAFVHHALQYRNLLLVMGLMLICAFLYAPYMLPFVAGLAAAVHVRRGSDTQHPIVTIAGVLVGLYLLGYEQPVKAYAWVGRSNWLLTHNVDILLRSAGSVALILAVLRGKLLYGMLDHGFSRILGRLSFPLYLVHPILIITLSSKIFLSTSGNATAAIIATVIASMLVAWPLATIDAKWIAAVKKRISGLAN